MIALIDKNFIDDKLGFKESPMKFVITNSPYKHGSKTCGCHACKMTRYRDAKLLVKTQEEEDTQRARVRQFWAGG